MLDPITGTIIATLITSAAALGVAVFTHLKSSKCFGFDFEFSSSPTTNSSPSVTISPVTSSSSTKT